MSGVGEVKVDEVLKTDESDACVGRRPDGLHPCQPAEADPVARHLAQVAMLEQAAVVFVNGLGQIPRLLQPADRAADLGFLHTDTSFNVAHRCAV